MSFVVKKVVNRVFKETIQSKFNAEDPYYELVEIEKNGVKRTKKIRKRPPPEGLSANDSSILKRVSRRAWRLDVVFSMCGWRLGWSSIIGIVPVVGDIMNAYLSLLVIRLAHQVDGGLPPMILAQMVANILIDFLLGITPILGTIAGALYKANSRNSLVLERFLKKRASQNVANGLYLADPAASKKKSKSSWFPSYSSADTSLTMNVSIPPSVQESAGISSASVSTQPVTVMRVPGAPHVIEEQDLKATNSDI